MRALLAASLMVVAPAFSAERDELVISYPDDRGQVMAVLTYANSIEMNSLGGEKVVQTRYGPVRVKIVISQGPETLLVLEWPQELWPYPPEIEVVDGEEGRIEFIAPMM